MKRVKYLPVNHHFFFRLTDLTRLVFQMSVIYWTSWNSILRLIKVTVKVRAIAAVFLSGNVVFVTCFVTLFSFVSKLFLWKKWNRKTDLSLDWRSLQTLSLGVFSNSLGNYLYAALWQILLIGKTHCWNSLSKIRGDLQESVLKAKTYSYVTLPTSIVSINETTKVFSYNFHSNSSVQIYLNNFICK